MLCTARTLRGLQITLELRPSDTERAYMVAEAFSSDEHCLATRDVTALDAQRCTVVEQKNLLLSRARLSPRTNEHVSQRPEMGYVSQDSVTINHSSLACTSAFAPAAKNLFSLNP
jgi:hypothetical protein